MNEKTSSPVLIANHSDTRYIKQAESVLKQKYENWHITSQLKNKALIFPWASNPNLLRNCCPTNYKYFLKQILAFYVSITGKRCLYFQDYKTADKLLKQFSSNQKACRFSRKSASKTNLGFCIKNSECHKRLNIWLDKHPKYKKNKVKKLDIAMLLGLNVLVLSPHPDDEIIGCGGTIIKLLKVGANIHCLYLTDGSNTSALEGYPGHIRKTIREAEAKKVARILGVSDTIFWKEEDSKLKASHKNVRRLLRILQRINPKIIFVPFVDSRHQDHVTANSILKKALVEYNLDLKNIQILSYEVESLIPQNLYCDISDEFKQKINILNEYRIPMKVVNYVGRCTALNSYQAKKLHNNTTFAEAFFKLAAPPYIKLIPD